MLFEDKLKQGGFNVQKSEFVIVVLFRKRKRIGNVGGGWSWAVPFMLDM